MSHVGIPSDLIPTALLNPQWWEYNERLWRVRTRQFRFVGQSAWHSELHGAYFVGRNGRIVTPPLTPHIPIGYSAPPKSPRSMGKRTRAWVEVGGGLAAMLARQDFQGHVTLPVGLMDGRPFAWAGLDVGVSYTYVVDLPRDAAIENRSVARALTKAGAQQLRAERSDDWEGILSCIVETEQVKDFRHGLAIADLRLGDKVLGPDAFRGYVVRDRHGSVVSGAICLHLPGHQAVGWVGGSVRGALKDGSSPLMWDFVMADLHEAGAITFDLAGANIKGVAAGKAGWGYPVAPQLSIGRESALQKVKLATARNKTTRGLVMRAIDARDTIAARRRSST